MSVVLIIIIILILALAVFTARVVFELNNFSFSRYTIRSAKIRPGDNIRIAFISDLHSRKFGDYNRKLIRRIAGKKPDFIILGGDMITYSSFSNDFNAMDAIDGLSDVAPVYYAPGNHETKISMNRKMAERFDEYMDELDSADVSYLNNRVERMGDGITVSGLELGPKYFKKFKRSPKSLSYKALKARLGFIDTKKFNILIAHKPEYFPCYAKAGYDLILSGHNHGGTVRIPGKGGLISPDLTFFPKYCYGAFRRDRSVMIVSRGIGSHGINIRLNNKPELIFIDIKGVPAAGRAVRKKGAVV